MTPDQGVRAWMATSRQVLPKQTQVTAMMATNDLVLLGTRSGRILCYQIEFGLLRSGQCLSEVGKRQGPIMQLAVLDSIHIILALSDGLMHLFSLPTFSHIGVIRVEENRVPVSNVVRFITRPIFGSVEVVVATRRQLTFCKYDSVSKTFQSTKKALFVPSAPLSLSWICGKLCIGFEKEFTLVDVDTGQVESLWLFESGPAFSIGVNSAHTILSCRKNAISFSIRPNGICIHSRVNWGGDHRTPIALCVQDSLLFVSFRDHIGVFTVDDISHPIGRIDLVNVSVLLATTDVIIAGNSEAIFILRRMSSEVLQRDVLFLDKVASSDGIERELHMQNFFNNSLAVDSQHPYAQSIDAFIKSQSDISIEDPVLVCRRIRIFMDAFAGCILDDLLANDILLNQRHQYLVTLWISFPLFAGSLFDSIFDRFKAKHMADDQKLAESYQRLKSTSLAQFGSSIKIEDPVGFFDSSLALLRRLPKLRSPFAMFELLSENLSTNIYKTIQDAGNGCGVSELTADEYIPILVFIVIQSGVQQLHSYISFMSAFATASESRGPIGYVLTTMSICLEHINNLLEARAPDEEAARTPLIAETIQEVIQERTIDNTQSV